MRVEPCLGQGPSRVVLRIVLMIQIVHSDHKWRAKEKRRHCLLVYDVEPRMSQDTREGEGDTQAIAATWYQHATHALCTGDQAVGKRGLHIEDVFGLWIRGG